MKCEGCKHEAECREQVCLYDFYEKGKADREKEILELNQKYIDMLINALNDTEENETLHNVLAEQRAEEIMFRKTFADQIKEQTNEKK